MSSVVISGNTSGTITLDAPAVAGTTTLTLPVQTGTVMVNGPAFSAYQSSAQSISNSTTTKIQFQTEEYDTNSNYDNATNYRFTPTVAGYYQVSAAMLISSPTGFADGRYALLSIYKNGAEFKRLNMPNTDVYSVGGSALVYFNGSTDYVEMYTNFFAASSPTNLLTGNYATYFQAVMVRGA
jgi:hypothetical protein